LSCSWTERTATDGHVFGARNVFFLFLYNIFISTLHLLCRAVFSLYELSLFLADIIKIIHRQITWSHKYKSVNYSLLVLMFLFLSVSRSRWQTQHKANGSSLIESQLGSGGDERKLNFRHSEITEFCQWGTNSENSQSYK